MKPESGYFLDKAHKTLGEAESVLAIKLYDLAGRMAYLAGFHAAQAFISEQTDRSVKTHKGVRIELHRLTKDHPGFPPELRAFLAQNYNLKTIADYENRTQRRGVTRAGDAGGAAGEAFRRLF